MTNNLYIYNMDGMSLNELYTQAKNLAVELGYDLKPLKDYTPNNLKNKIKTYLKNIKNRDRRYNMALRISRINREPLKKLAILSGTDYAHWNREVRRLQMRARRNPEAIQKIQEARNAVAPILAQVRKTDNLQRQRQQKRSRLIKAQLQRQVKRKIIDRFIKNGKFQQIFNMVRQNQDDVLTLKQATNFYNAVISRGKFNIKLVVNGITKNIAFNDTTRDFIIKVLTDGFILEEGEQFESDAINNMDISEIEELQIIPLTKPNKIFKNKDGKFFAYINTTNLDLTKYQIYNQEQAYDLKNREHCLIHTLLECGIDKAKANEIKFTFKSGCNFKKTDLKQVAEIINKCIILHSIRPCGKTRKEKFKGGDEIINIAIHESHYFIYEDTIYSKFFINNYEKCKDMDNKFNIVKLDKDARPQYADDRKINSLVMVEKLLKGGYFKKLDMIMFEEASTHRQVREHIYLENIENEQEPCDIKQTDENEDGDEWKKEKKEKPKKIFYADCESFVNGDNHELYLLGCANDINDFVSIYNVCDEVNKNQNVGETQYLVYRWLKAITRSGKQNALVYFHNLKYDYHLLEPYINIKNKCEKDGSLYNVIITYNKCEIELRDSYKILPFALSKFTKEFDLDNKFSKKEAINYTYYKKENNDKHISINDYLNGLSKKEKEIFKKNVKEEYTYDSYTKFFNPTSYYIDYLKLDCLVLKKGIQKFNTLIKEITENKMNVYDCLTISSLTDKYMFKEGSYDGVYKVKGNLRAYISKAVYGGRVCVNKKYKKKIIEGKISDYDGVSLYPSAINRLCRELGLPKGKAARFTKEELKNWNTKLYSILTIKINKVNKIQQMPFIAHKDENGLLEYTNEAPKETLIIDSITLQDYIKFHKIDYELLDGVYWNNGSNKKMGEVIQRLFNARLQAKKDKKNALSNTIKLMLNSAYGKTIMKKSKTETKIIKTEENKYDKKTKEWIKQDKMEQVKNYIYNNFNTIKWHREINEKNYEVEKICSDSSYNRGHIGCAILSMSKRIMNEVFDVANTEKAPIYYTDTDSLHCNLWDVNRINLAYWFKYKKELTGKNLEQFHTDFDLDGAKEEIYATKSIFLGKKSYLDVLESKDKNGNTINGYHIRLKGITEAGLKHQSKNYINSYEGLYTDLAQGKEIEIPLNPYDTDEEKQKVMFEYVDGKVRTRKIFGRKVKF